MYSRLSRVLGWGRRCISEAQSSLRKSPFLFFCPPTFVLRFVCPKEHLDTYGVDLPGYIKYFAAIAIPLTAILLFVKEVKKSVTESYEWVWRRLAPKESVHSVELRVVPDYQRSHWPEGSMSLKPHMPVACRLNITNVADTWPAS